MRVSDDQVRAACATAAEVYEGRIGRADGIRRLVEEHGVNEASAGDFINDYRDLAEGRIFHRAMSASAMHHFIAEIEQKHGPAGLANAVKALRAHIGYYESQSGTRMHGMRRVAEEFEDRLKSNSNPAHSSRAYLLTWNPEHFTLGDDGEVVPGSEHRWTCHSKQPMPGDRVYLIRLGVDPKGIVVTGTVTQGSFEAAHWKDSANTARYIKFQVEDYRPDAASGMLPMALLLRALPEYKWSPQSSGVLIPQEDEAVLSQLWSSGKGLHSLLQYVSWTRNNPTSVQEGWLRAYEQTVELAASLSKQAEFDEQALDRIWRTPNNGVTNVAAGALSTDEFKMNLPVLSEMTRAIANDPGPTTLAAIEARWQQAVAEGRFSSLKRAVIRRVFAAVAPHRYTTALREADCQSLLKLLRTQFQLEPAANPSDRDWSALNDAIASCAQRAGLVDLNPANNVALWMLVRSGGDAPAVLDRPSVLPESNPVNSNTEPPKNLVLFGPPGTGKTYSSVDETIALLAPELMDGNPDRQVLKARFDQMVASGEVVFTTFHQSFTYEDFVEGLRAEPRDGQLEFRVVDGVFKSLCKAAAGQAASTPLIPGEMISSYTVKRCTSEIVELIKPNGKRLPIAMTLLQELTDLVRSGQITVEDIREKTVFDKIQDSSLEPYLVNGYANVFALLVSRLLERGETTQQSPRPRVLIIDEINRGNVSRIFGELITLIEPDKREGMPEALQVTLPYSKEAFSVPANLHIIATMNTADRSLVGIDIALRRRFEFRELLPRPELLDDLLVETVSVGDVLRTINERIEVLLDREHCLGHAHFLSLREAPALPGLARIFRQKILPLLQEYFYDDWERIRWVLNDHRKPPEHQFVRAADSQSSHLFGPDVTLAGGGHALGVERRRLRQTWFLQSNRRNGRGMNTLVTVREFATLSAGVHREAAGLDTATVPKTDFDWLANCGQLLGLNGMPLTTLASPTTLRLSNYVGVLETPSGTRIEILPKHVSGAEDVDAARAVLRKMIAAALDLPKHTTTPTDLRVFKAPVSEWIIHRFLAETKRLLARGLRSEYREISSEERFIRGRLHAVRQLRQPPSRQHLAQVQFDVFVHDRAENRLIRSAVDAALKVTKEPASWRLAQEFRARLQEIPFSPNVAEDFRAWRNDRLSASYSAVRPWCELILRTLLPVTVVGRWRGVSLLFPMEKLFERYVAAWLRGALDHRAKLHAPAGSEFLCQHQGRSVFQLRPDLLIDAGRRRWVLDTKWKLLDGTAQETKYGLSEADFYQLFAYGNRYLADREGELALIYPASLAFQKNLPVFQFSDQLRLWVVPFDLQDDQFLIEPQILQLPLLSRSQPEHVLAAALSEPELGA